MRYSLRAAGPSVQSDVKSFAASNKESNFLSRDVTVESRFLRPSQKIIVTGAVALLAYAGSPAANAQDANSQTPAAQQPAAGQTPAAGAQPAAGAKNWKDRAEYDLAQKVSTTQDPKARLDLLNQWQDKYPQSDYADLRTQYLVPTLGAVAQTDPTSRQMVVTKVSDILKQDPKNFRAAVVVSQWGPVVGGASPSPDVQTQVQTAAQAVIADAPDAFDASKKPPTVQQADFDKAKTQVLGLAHNALAWVATTKNDKPGAESEYKASLQANPDQGTISAMYAKMLADDKKMPEALFEYARAAEYTGPGPAVPEATRKQLQDYFTKAYQNYHGSPEGADQMMTQAKTQAVPPDGLTLTNAQAKADADAEGIKKRIDSDPAFKIWYAVQQNLVGDQGQSFFDKSVKGLEIPGDSVPSKTFSGTVISIDPPDRPTKVVLGVDDPAKPDATLTFSQPLPASALDKIKVGQKIDFSGIADSFTKDPYMLTFGDPTIPGVQTAAPARHGRHK